MSAAIRTMIRTFFWFAGAALAVFAQQGHPLTGTWSGDAGSASGERTKVTIVLNWDGKNVSGVINPGPDAIPISSVYVDYSTWTVRIEAEDKSHQRIVAEGKLSDIGSYHRTIAGEFQRGSAKGDFKLTRD